MRWSLLLVAVACTHAPAPTVTKETPTSPDLDVLFMIDNSAQIADKQTVFAEDLPALVAAFNSFPAAGPISTSASSIRRSTSAATAH